MKKLLTYLFLMLSILTYSQKKEVDFSRIIEYYKTYGYAEHIEFLEKLKEFGDTINHKITIKEYQNKYLKDITDNTLYKIFDDTNSKKNETGIEKYVSISKKPIYFNLIDTIIPNPYINEIKEKKNVPEFNYDDRYPLSFSVIYNEHIITLFEPGKFTCISTKNLKRNKEFEKKLNTKKFQKLWLLNGKLVAKNKSKTMFWNGDKWKKYKQEIILESKPVLFEDDKHIVFSDCWGEYGGKIYFYNKKTKQTHCATSTCVIAVYKKDNKYYILNNLGHMLSDISLKYIENPDNLPIISKEELRKEKKRYRHKCKTSLIKNIFSYYGFQYFGTFTYNGRRIYIANIGNKTLLIEREANNDIKIVNPLFNNNLYTHHPVTHQYGKFTLINLDFWGVAGKREIALLLIKDNKITRINWNKKNR